MYKQCWCDKLTNKDFLHFDTKGWSGCVPVVCTTWFNMFTVKSRLSERRLSETTGLFEDDGQSRLFSLLSIAIKLLIIRISIIRKNQFFEVIRRSRLKNSYKITLQDSKSKMSRMVIMISCLVEFDLHTRVI